MRLEKYEAAMLICVLLALLLVYEHITFRMMVDGEVASLTPSRCQSLLYNMGELMKNNTTKNIINTSEIINLSVGKK